MRNSLHIHSITPEELPDCIPFGVAFHQEMQLPGRFVPLVFLRNWERFLAEGHGTILGLYDEHEKLVGGLGVLLGPDLNDGRLVATETFWFVDAQYRQGRAPLRLLAAYRQWAQEHGAVEWRLVHLLTGPDSTRTEKLGHLYHRLGLRPIETGWAQAL